MMNVKHVDPKGSKFQIVNTEIDVEFTVDDIVKFCTQLSHAKCVELKDKLCTHLKGFTGTSDVIKLNGISEIEVNMEKLVAMMEFDEFIFDYLNENRYVLIRKPTHLGPLIEFERDILEIEEKFQKNYGENLLGGDL